jgi:CelD/BcsL family acetyltransferase involved in cellulose biosynthesis
MSASSIQIQVLDSFDSRALPPERWSSLLSGGETDTVFLTWWWQKTWWECFGRGRLLLVLAERHGSPIALAPLFADSGMIFFVGSGGSDYLDFVGDIRDGEVLTKILAAAGEAVSNFVGFRFYHVPDASRTGSQLCAAGERLHLRWYDEGSLPSPQLSLRADSEAASKAAGKTSLRRHERFFAKHGTLQVQHVRSGEEIRAHLDGFFRQHVDRWAGTPHPSLFRDPTQCRFYEGLTHGAEQADWLRFTSVQWDGRPIAYHFGFCHRGRFLWYKPSFEIQLARHSPGEVLLRHLLLSAIQEDAEVFDFGLGDEAFKQRFATQVNEVRTWGLYPG